MSETFYIKKTAFDDNNFDLAQRETDSFIIGPGELNGPGGLAQDSDLELYGFGSLKWGEGVDQNQYRLMESSACPAKLAGDFLVGTDDLNTYIPGNPGNGSYTPGTNPVPKDENDLGIGNGITEPLIGQLWYNTSTKILYNYELPGVWETVFKEVTDVFNTHVADDTVHLRDGQNEFLDDLILGGSPLSLQAHDVNQLIGIRDNDGTVQDQIDLMVDTRGDIMTGTLTISTTTPQFKLHETDAAVDEKYWRFYVSGGQLIFDIHNDANTIATPIFTVDRSTNTVDSLNFNTPVTTTETIFSNNHLVTKLYTDTKAPLASPVFTGNPQAPTPATSDNDESIATTRFVKNQVSNAGNVITSAASGNVTVPAGITRVEVAIIGGGGGGAQGSDGGSFTGVNNAVNGTASVITIPSVGSRSAGGGEHAIPSQHVDQFAYTTHGRTNGGFGISSRGGRGDPGGSSRGGDGGGSELGYGGTGGSGSGPTNTGQAGWQGGGGGGGSGQDNGGGCGGDSGHLYRQVATVVAGQSISWTIGTGGNGGSGSGRGNGGKGGNGYIIIRWSN